MEQNIDVFLENRTLFQDLASDSFNAKHNAFIDEIYCINLAAAQAKRELQKKSKLREQAQIRAQYEYDLLQQEEIQREIERLCHSSEQKKDEKQSFEVLYQHQATINDLELQLMRLESVESALNKQREAQEKNDLRRLVEKHWREERAFKMEEERMKHIEEEKLEHLRDERARKKKATIELEFFLHRKLIDQKERERQWQLNEALARKEEENTRRKMELEAMLTKVMVSKQAVLDAQLEEVQIAKKKQEDAVAFDKMLINVAKPTLNVNVVLDNEYNSDSEEEDKLTSSNLAIIDQQKKEQDEIAKIQADLLNKRMLAIQEATIRVQTKKLEFANRKKELANTRGETFEKISNLSNQLSQWSTFRETIVLPKRKVADISVENQIENESIITSVNSVNTIDTILDATNDNVIIADTTAVDDELAALMEEYAIDTAVVNPTDDGTVKKKKRAQPKSKSPSSSARTLLSKSNSPTSRKNKKGSSKPKSKK